MRATLMREVHEREHGRPLAAWLLVEANPAPRLDTARPRLGPAPR